MHSYQQEIPQTWFWRLREEYENIRNTIPEFSQCSQVSLHIELKEGSNLGLWQRDTKIITINAKVLREASWNDITFILKHEMAHQLADEYFHAQSETAHGPAFQKACNLLGISHQATFSFKKDEKKEKILRKIDKLLALGESPNHHEAEVALAKAQEVSLRYNIKNSAEEKNNYSLRLIGPINKRMPNYIGLITNILSEFYFVEAILKGYLENNDHYKQWEICGTLENLDLAEYVFYFLLHQGEYEWQLYRREKGSGVGRYRNTFLFGLYDAFRDKLRNERQNLENQHALIYRGDVGLDQFFQQLYPRVRNKKTRISCHADISADGAKIGSKMNIKPGINKAQKKLSLRRLLNG